MPTGPAGELIFLEPSDDGVYVQRRTHVSPDQSIETRSRSTATFGPRTVGACIFNFQYLGLCHQIERGGDLGVGRTSYPRTGMATAWK
jgi:hypothetical protein